MEGAKRGPNPELWHACAGPLVSLPSAGTRVVYFPQGHSEQVAASTQREADAQIPSYPNLPPHLICQLHNVTLHADVETDEVYAQMTLQPTTQEKEGYMPSDLGRPNRQPSEYFCKTLTASDTSTHGGFSIPRRAAEKVFPPLDFTQQPPAQEIVARDLHDNEWRFRHIYRGQPRRHLLTTGWSIFVGSKKLQTGDSVLFIRDDKGQLLIGIRHANRQQASMPLSLLSTDSMYIGILAAAAHAHATNSRFTIFYNPRASPSEFVIPWSKYYNAVCNNMQVSTGMRFRMQFETEESSVRRHTGTITGSGDLDPVRWPNSYWRSLKVEWDEPTAGEKQQRISLWEIEPVTTPYLVCSPSFTFRSRRPWSQALGPTSVAREVDEIDANTRKWIKCENLEQNLSWNLYPDQIVQLQQQHQQRPDPPGRSEYYRADDSRIAEQQMHHSQHDVIQNKQQHYLAPPQYNPQLGSDPSLQLSSGSQGLKAAKEHGACGETDITLNSFGRTFQSNILDAYSVVGRGRHETEGITGGINKDGWYTPERDFNQGPGEPPLQLGHLDGYSANGTLFSIADIDQGGSAGGLTQALSFKETHQDHDSLHLDSRNLLFGVNIDASAECNPATSEGLKSKDQSMNRVHSSGAAASDHNLATENGSEEPQQRQQQQLPPRTFTKVYKTGSVGRSLDLTRLHSYSELRCDLARMFNLEGQLEDPLRSGWQLVFVDNENDVLLVGDDPWEEFVSCVRCIKIMSPAELQQMNQDQLNAMQLPRASDDLQQQDSNGGKAL